jgi:Protein of unknown function (DUF2628)
MSVYTVYAPPLRAADTAPNPERFVVVRDGFSIWAFLFAALWMLWHRMWLVLLLYLVIGGVIEAALRYAGFSDWVLVAVAVALSFLVGAESSTLRHFTLERRGFRTVGVVSGDNLEMAERRFFDAWVRDGGRDRPDRGAPPASPPPPFPRAPQSSGVTGLFPEPGANR